MVIIPVFLNILLDYLYLLETFRHYLRPQTHPLGTISKSTSTGKGDSLPFQDIALNLSYFQ